MSERAKFQCPKCDKIFTLDEYSEGDKIICPYCLFGSKSERKNEIKEEKKNIQKDNNKIKFLQKNKIIIVAVIVLSISIIGFVFFMDEIINEDEEFLNKAKIIYSELYPVSEYNLISLNIKAEDYRLELADYKLSSKCESIREDIDFACQFIGFAYWAKYETYIPNYKVMDADISLANQNLESAKFEIDELT